MRSPLQFALDFFDAAPVAALQVEAEPLSPRANQLYRHPRATRETSLSDVRVAYEFKRGKRRTIGFVVGPDGLVVSAPKWVPLYEVEAALQEKSDWIVRKLNETRQRHERLEATRIDWRDGASFPFLGQQVIVVIDPAHDFSTSGGGLKRLGVDVEPGALPQSDAKLDSTGDLRLHIGLAHNASSEQIRDAVQAWLMRQAKRHFTARLDHFASQLQVKWVRLSLSNAGTRWGSARADGSIRLNWRLIHFKPSVLDYVVVHELSHLRVMDHSPRFWDTVRSVIPQFDQLREQLKDDAIPRWQ
jgi:predicted metal-dependent hydrolase